MTMYVKSLLSHFSPHLRFNNLTLISPHGLPGELPPDELREQMSASSMCYDQDAYAQMALRAWVNVVYGHMTAIDRHVYFSFVLHLVYMPSMKLCLSRNGAPFSKCVL